MTDTNDKIEWFRASTAYINAHRGNTFVVLLSGEALLDDNFPNIVYDLNLLHSLGVKLVLVHGARPQISSALANADIESSYHLNQRISNAADMETIKQIVGSLSIDLEAKFSMGLTDSPMHGSDIRLSRGNFVTAKPVGIHGGIDFHYTGHVRKIDTQAINEKLQQNNIVLLSNLGYSLTGEVFNLTAEEVATETAIALNADKLILLTPDDGVKDEAGKLITSLNRTDAASYADSYCKKKDADSLCTGQALLAAIHAFENKVHRTHLISYKHNGAVLQELFTREGNGTLISSDNFDLLRDASIDDVAGILSLIRPLEEDGSLVVRSRELLENEITNFSVIELEGVVIACAALYEIGDNCAEIACIAINKNSQKNGYGDRLLTSLESKARENGIDRLFVLTTVATHWFIEKGFSEVALSDLPEQRQSLYNLQRKSKVFSKLLFTSA